MGEENKKALEEALARTISDIETLELGSEERERAVAEIKTFFELGIKQYQAEWDSWEKEEKARIESEKNAAESENKKEQAQNDRLRAGLDTVKVLGGSVVSAIAANKLLTKILTFEETGVITSKALAFIPKIKFW